jgi:hypothetical protein
MQLINSHNLFHRIEIDGSTHTAIDTSIASSGPGMNKIQRNLTGPAFHIRSSSDGLEVKEIPLKKLLSIEGTIHIILDEYFSGHTLLDYLSYREDFSPAKASLFTMLAGLFRERPDILPSSINPNHLLHCDDNSLFLLPQNWSTVLSAYESEAQLERGAYRLNYPDSSIYDRARLQTYFLANALQYMITRRWLYPADELEAYRRLQRKQLALPVRSVYRDAPDELSRWIDGALKLEEESIPDNLAKTLQELAATPPNIPGEALPDLQDKSTMEALSDIPEISSYRRQIRRDALFNSLRRHSVLVIGISVATVLVIAGLITTVQNLTEDLEITGLEPAEVVREFYLSYNRLDHEFMNQATDRGVGRSEINRISNMFVVSTIREGTELRSVFIPASQWLAIDEDQRPSLVDNMVFGITDLEVVETNRLTDSDGNTVIAFEVSYIIWDPAQEEERLLRIKRRDRLRVREFRRGWKIIEITSSDPQ